MADILQREFGIAGALARGTQPGYGRQCPVLGGILRQAGIKRVVLVTQAFHMPRARLLFEAAGLQVVPAPAHFVSKTGAVSRPAICCPARRPAPFLLRPARMAGHRLGAAFRRLRRLPEAWRKVEGSGAG
jgi:uncharacterized SAM-binding protein YcdF (DUF218 family)